MGKKIAISETDRALLDAIASGKPKAIAAALRAGSSPDAKNEAGSPALSFAALRGDAAACAQLLDAGARINARAPDGASPLMAAAAAPHAECCQLLLERGADFMARGPKGATALLLAAERAWRPDAALAILAAGAFPSAQDDEGVSPLMKACSGHTPGGLRLVLALLAAGAQVDAISKKGRTALTTAAGAGDHAACDALLRAGADPRKIGAMGLTPLLCAEQAWQGGPKCRGLIEAALAQAVAKDERSALDWVSLSQAEEMARLEALTAPRVGLAGTELPTEPPPPPAPKRARSL